MPRLVGPITNQTGITPPTTDSSGALATTSYIAANRFAADNTAVHIASPELITGVKTFTTNPTVPTGARPGYVLTATDITGSVAWRPTPQARSICCGRLTATSGDPVGTREVGSTSTIYYTPFQGNLIGLYNGVNWDLLTFNEIVIPIPQYICTGNQNWDIFAYNNNGVVSIEPQPWAPNSISVRNIPLDTQDGVYVKSGDATRRYLGSFYCYNNLTADAVNDRAIWNYYNRIAKKVCMTVPNAWTYNSSWRVVAGDGTLSIATMVGVRESPIELQGCVSSYEPDNATFYGVGIGYDWSATTTAGLVSSGDNGFNCIYQQLYIHIVQTTSTYHITDIGLHTYWLTEYGGSANIQLYGGAGSGGRNGGVYPGMVGLFMC